MQSKSVQSTPKSPFHSGQLEELRFLDIQNFREMAKQYISREENVENNAFGGGRPPMGGRRSRSPSVNTSCHHKLDKSKPILGTEAAHSIVARIASRPNSAKLLEFASPNKYLSTSYIYIYIYRKS